MRFENHKGTLDDSNFQKSNFAPVFGGGTKKVVYRLLKKSCFFADATAKLIKFWGFQMLQKYRVKNLNHKGQVL